MIIKTQKSIVFALILGAVTGLAQVSDNIKPADTAEKPQTKVTAKAEWGDNFEKAVATAKAKKLPICALFTGSDWCRWCVSLNNEVFKTKEFQDYAAKNLVLFIADFPRAGNQSAAVKAQNRKLAEKYGVGGFPTVLFLKDDGTVIGTNGYMRGGPSVYLKSVKKILSNKK